MPLAEKPNACKGCPASNVGFGFVEAVGPRTAQIALLGQGPGQQEAYAQIPFYGRAGRQLNWWLTRAGLRRSDLWIGNCVQCWLRDPTTGKDRAPRRAEWEHCQRAHWGPWLQELPDLRVVVAIGVPAMKAIIDPSATAGWAGRVVEVEL